MMNVIHCDEMRFDGTGVTEHFPMTTVKLNISLVSAFSPYPSVDYFRGFGKKTAT